jgi:PAS domain S-box-containing protein
VTVNSEPDFATELRDLDPARIDDVEFRLLADHLPILCWIANGDGYIVWYNRRWYEYTGATPAQMQGWGWRSVHDPATLPEVEARWAESIATGLPFEMQFPLQGADGVFRPFLTRIQPLRDGSGRVTRWFGVNTDVTDQRAAEKAFRIERDRYASVLNGMDEGFALLDRDFRILEMNAAGLGVDGRPREAVIGQVYWDVFPRTAGTPLETLYRGAIADRSPAAMEHCHVWPDGRRTWFDVRVYPVAAGLAVFFRDISARRSMEERLHAKGERMRIALAAGHLGDWDWLIEADVLSLSERAHAIFGTEPGPLSWASLRAMLHPEDAAVAQQAVQTSIETGEDYSCEYRVKRTDGRWIWVAAHGRPVAVEAGAPKRMIGIVRDVTGRHRAEEQRKLLIDELNHRVKNTLAIVQGLAQQTLRGSPEIDEARLDFEGRLMALSTAHSLLTKENWRSADLRTVIWDTITTHDPSGERFTVEGPEVRLEPQSAVAFAMAVHELCTNAVKYGALSTADGRVQVRWRRESATSRLHIIWTETGGPPVSTPTKRGFGARMIERALAAELRGEAKMRFEPLGFVCEIDVAPPEGAS